MMHPTCSAYCSLHGWQMVRMCFASHPPAGCCWADTKPQVCRGGQACTLQRAILAHEEAFVKLIERLSIAWTGQLLLGSPDRAVHLGSRLMQLSLDALTVHRCSHAHQRTPQH
jgi:hypothetical protein